MRAVHRRLLLAGAVASDTAAGVFPSVAAGNDNKDACKFSPSGAGWVMATGATSMAPYVSGVAALYLSTRKKATFPQVQKWLNDNSTHGLKGLRTQPDRLLHKGKL